MGFNNLRWIDYTGVKPWSKVLGSAVFYYCLGGCKRSLSCCSVKANRQVSALFLSRLLDLSFIRLA